jgi:hypothetical protein
MPLIPDGPAMTPAERRKLFPKSPRGRSRSNPMPRGYAAEPGTGPAGETCGSCRHHAERWLARTYHKCGLMSAYWTGGGATDIRVRSPACSRWEKADA